MIKGVEWLRCPLCQSNFSLNDRKSIRCSNGHSFDLAKEGYVNLLPVQKKNSKTPGDSKEMLIARRQFLEAGFYDPLVEKINLILNREEVDVDRALDVGCGEGFYGIQILSNRCKTIIGTDISKEAVKMCSKRGVGFYFVASIYDLPIRSKSMDLITSIFTPVDLDEFKRVLSSNGHVLTVTAGARHMKEFAELIYQEVRAHTYDPYERFQSDFDRVLEEEVKFTIALNKQEDIENCLMMTPYYWKFLKTNKALPLSLDLTCHFRISLFKKNDRIDDDHMT